MKVVKKKFKFSLFLQKFFLVGLVVYIFCSLFFQSEKIKRKKELLADVAAKVKSQDTKNQDLISVAEITDKSAERQAKLKLEFSKEGERVFVVTEG